MSFLGSKFNTAKSLSVHRKKRIALSALAKTKTKIDLAKENGVSRKFVRKEQHRLKIVVDKHYQKKSQKR